MTDAASPSGPHARTAGHHDGRRPRSIGDFRFCFADQWWAWSDEVARLHGYEPGAVEPTTELLLTHKHPEDRDMVAWTLDEAVCGSNALCRRHRIIGTGGAEHHVLVVADRLFDGAGTVIGTTGYYIDLDGDLIDEDRQHVLDEAVPDVVDARAAIEQAKGVLMSVYGISADQAFAILRWRSQETNTKIRQLAENLVTALPTVGGSGKHQRSRFDHLLLTIHESPAPAPRTGR
ncbi:PAS and ANTAR domain-containing protein [Amycolatopsis jiangsuensis]|uniref:ANTAR domain-containing protein n=1 Tax=Amycolatopsis jiangsuensis TaxID=1181879 RepID=A0A840IZY1_9PSEU|nr:PAS and ANTAR domain-containing protein [Amycolatopsis jiangsuensis]MBB4686752.1 hypothetical protein [Amycolatopsis jiangsuensis]